MKNILFVISDGLGNMVQALPALAFAKKKRPNDKFYVWCGFSHFSNAVFPLFKENCEEVFTSSKDFCPKNFQGQMLMALAKRHRITGLRVISDDSFKLVGKKSEVEWNLRCVDHDYTDDDVGDIGGALDYVKSAKNVPDILIHNGYNKATNDLNELWIAKSYSQWGKVARILKNKGLTVGSIGSKDEYVRGTVNLTDTSIYKTMSLLKGCKVFLSNDTGTYHLANALKVPNIVVFTFTCNCKNYDKRFHKYSTLIRRTDLECSPCQVVPDGGRKWIENREKCKWVCREIDPRVVVESVLGRL